METRNDQAVESKNRFSISKLEDRIAPSLGSMLGSVTEVLDSGDHSCECDTGHASDTGHSSGSGGSDNASVSNDSSIDDNYSRDDSYAEDDGFSYSSNRGDNSVDYKDGGGASEHSSEDSSTRIERDFDAR